MDCSLPPKPTRWISARKKAVSKRHEYTRRVGDLSNIIGRHSPLKEPAASRP